MLDAMLEKYQLDTELGILHSSCRWLGGSDSCMFGGKIARTGLLAVIIIEWSW